MNKIAISVMSAALAGLVSARAAMDKVIITADYLSQLSEEMRTNHPSLQAAEALRMAAAADVNAVRTWEDPMLMVGGLAANKTMRADEGDILYGIEQKLPLFGKPGLQREVAHAALATETAAQDLQFQKLRSDLAKAAFRTALAERTVALSEQDLIWLDTTRRAQEDKARVGQVPLADVVQIQNARCLRETQLQTERDQLKQERVTLNRLLGRDELAPWPALELPPVAGPVDYSPRLTEFALKNEPKTAMQARQIKRAEAQVAVARRQYYPDIAVGVEARNYSGSGAFRQEMVTLRMDLPWFNQSRLRSDVRREQARLAAAQAELADEQAAVREELHLLTIKADAARREALLYQDQIIPRTTATLKTITAGWQAGQNTFRELMETQRALLEAQLAQTRAVSEQYQILSELVLCCGLGDLGALQMIGAQPATPMTDDGSPTEN